MANTLAEEIRQASRRFKAHGRKQSDADELCEVALLDLAILVEASGAETSDEFEERRYGARVTPDEFMKSIGEEDFVNQSVRRAWDILQNAKGA